MHNSEPIISFTFDDFPRSALLIGGAILAERGWEGTFYTSFGLMGKVGRTGQIFSLADLAFLDGHELGCHTFDHFDAWETVTPIFEESIKRNAAELQSHFPGQRFVTLAYPINPPRPATKRMCAQHFLACRAGGQECNSGMIDLNAMRGFFLEQSRDSFEEIERQIQLCLQRKAWLIFATHDVAEAPTPFGVTPVFFERVVQAVARTGARVLPVGKALACLSENK